MIVMTINNWRKKLKVLLVIIILAFLIGIVWMMLGMGKHGVESAENDRDAHGSLRVEAGSSSGEEVGTNWLVEFMEVIKAVNQ